MLTLFTIPKPFVGQIATIQHNAIRSWLELRPSCEIILCGNDSGVADAAREYGLRQISNVVLTNYGTPLLSSAFAQVQQTASHALICYVNSDIIILTNLSQVIARVPFRQFLMLGRRWDLDVTAPLDFAYLEWRENLWERVRSQGSLHPPSGSDYFVFPRGSIGVLPDFAVGRPGWDNWFIYRARSLGLPVVDATDAITIVHQNHNYAHIPGGRVEASWDGPESDDNLRLMGGDEHRYTIDDVTHRFRNQQVVRVMPPGVYFRQQMRRFFELHPRLNVIARIWHRLS